MNRWIVWRGVLILGLIGLMTTGADAWTPGHRGGWKRSARFGAAPWTHPVPRHFAHGRAWRGGGGLDNSPRTYGSWRDPRSAPLPPPETICARHATLPEGFHWSPDWPGYACITLPAGR